jgi:hypothetical protein
MAKETQLQLPVVSPLPRKPESFDVPPYVGGSRTSIDASLSMHGKTAGIRQKVYELLLLRGPMTDEAIAVTLKLNPSTARPRRIELTEDGIVAKVGEGKTRSGRKASLWGVVSGKEAG